MTPEGAVKKQIKDYFNEQGWYHFWPVQMGLGAATVDCLACVGGRFVAVEVKRPGLYTPTKRQALTIKTVSKAGGIAFTTDSLGRTVEYLQQHALGLYNPEDPFR